MERATLRSRADRGPPTPRALRLPRAHNPAQPTSAPLRRARASPPRGSPRSIDPARAEPPCRASTPPQCRRCSRIGASPRKSWAQVAARFGARALHLSLLEPGHSRTREGTPHASPWTRCPRRSARDIAGFRTKCPGGRNNHEESELSVPAGRGGAGAGRGEPCVRLRATPTRPAAPPPRARRPAGRAPCAARAGACTPGPPRGPARSPAAP